jgi:hypothetical protein
MKNIKIWGLLVSILLVFSCEVFGQIRYNIEKPYSSKIAGITKNQEVEPIVLKTGYNGNLNKSNLNINLKNDGVHDFINGKYMARTKIFVDTDELGFMTIAMNDVNLSKEAKCYVYTKNYEIVAGPITQSSIDNTIRIVNIPARELTVEVVSPNEEDLNLSIDEVHFVPKMKKKKNRLQVGYRDWCPSCEYGTVSNFNYDGEYMDLQMFGWLVDLLDYSRVYSIMDKPSDIVRSACVIYRPTEDMTGYNGAPGTLMNFPIDECAGYIFAANHVKVVFDIKDWTIAYNSAVASENAEQAAYYNERLDAVIIRFNLHHKYGTPDYLIDNGVEPVYGTDTWNAWRNTVDFDEVIDYCGAYCYAYGKQNDLVILKMHNKPFYKEHRLGWTTQIEERTKSIYPTSNFRCVGRKTAASTFGVGAKTVWYDKDFDWYQFGVDPTTTQLDGFSGSMMTRKGLEYSDTELGIGLAQLGYNSDGVTMVSTSLYGHIYGSNNDFYVIDPDSYKQDPETDPPKDFSSFLAPHMETETETGDNNRYMPSLDNSEVCPSDSNVNCNFDLSEHISIGHTSQGVYVTINIPETIDVGGQTENVFSPGGFPSGLRVYRDYYDQETYYYDNWNDNYNIKENAEGAITIDFWIDAADVFYYRYVASPAINELDIKFDFYDKYGRVYQTDCSTDISKMITVPIKDSDPTDQIDTDIMMPCDFFKITATQVDETNYNGPNGETEACCTYELSLEMNLPMINGQSAKSNDYALFKFFEEIESGITCNFISYDGNNDAVINFSYNHQTQKIVSDQFTVCGNGDVNFQISTGDFNCFETMPLYCSDVEIDCCSNIFVDFPRIYYFITPDSGAAAFWIDFLPLFNPSCKIQGFETQLISPNSTIIKDYSDNRQVPSMADFINAGEGTYTMNIKILRPLR